MDKVSACFPARNHLFLQIVVVAEDASMSQACCDALGTSEGCHVKNDSGGQMLHRVCNAITQHETTLRIRVVDFNSFARVQLDDL